MYLIGAMALSVTLASCEGCNSGNSSTKIGDGYSAGEEQKSDTLKMMEANIESNLKGYMQALSDARFSDYVTYVHPALFDSKEEIEAQAENLKRIYDGGWQNRVKKAEIYYISPLVDLDTAWATVVKFNMEVDVEFTDEFKGKPAVYENQIKSSFPYAVVEFDSIGRAYHVVGPDLFFCFSDKDSINFYFVTEQFISNPRINKIINAEKILELRAYR